MITRKLSCAALVCLLCSISSLAMAGSFTPEAGTTITSTSVTVTVGWTSTASEQWVRAYDSSAEKIFDSGRQLSSSGQVNFAVSSSETLLRVIFYEKTGSWVANERTYSVAIGSTDGGDTLANLTCSTNQIAQYDGAEWVCNDGLVDILDPTIAAILMRLDALESPTRYTIGDVGPAGGRVFHVSDGGLHGLEAAPEDQVEARWCESITDTGATGTAIGTGASNTEAILEGCPIAGNAADVASQYNEGGFEGWFLPSKDELNAMYGNIGSGCDTNLNPDCNVGVFASVHYWSSSEFENYEFAWFQDMTDGAQNGDGKGDGPKGVRAIRYF